MRSGGGRTCRTFQKGKNVTSASDYLKQLQPPQMPLPIEVPTRGALTIRVVRREPGARLPIRALPNAVGFDVFAFLLSESGRPISRALHQRAVTLVPTGISVEPPDGYFLQVCSRSGLAKQGIFVANAPGIIDPDYTGELQIPLFNGSHETKYIAHEHRIAQLVLAPLVPCGDPEEAHTLAREADRGEVGFGSTGA